MLDRLAGNLEAVRGLASGVSRDAARWRPEPRHWSILEIVNHLADEEVEDFRTRLDLALHAPGRPWPAIDPASWVAARAYADRDFDESVARFTTERTRSLEWLGTLESPDWSLAYEHPHVGRMTAGDLLASWVAHDHLHIRQLNRVHRAYLADVIAPGGLLDYAGDW